MPNILTNSKIRPKEKNNSFERTNFLSKDDLKTTFSYGVVAIFVAVAVWGVSASFIKQINKN